MQQKQVVVQSIVSRPELEPLWRSVQATLDNKLRSKRLSHGLRIIMSDQIYFWFIVKTMIVNNLWFCALQQLL